MKKLKRKLKDYTRDFLRVFLSPEKYIKLRFYLTHKYKLNLKNPKTWNEKIQYRKLYGDHELYAQYVDKYLVREKIKEIIGEEYLIPHIAKFEQIKPNDIDSLPNSFVIKTSNGGGGENVKIVKDKLNLNKEKLCKEFNKYIKIRNGKKTDEPFYDVNHPVIIIEKLILDSESKLPNDYKFHCFNQEENIKIIVGVDTGRFENHCRNFYDENWNLMDLKIAKKNTNLEIEKPKNFDLMIDIVKKLSRNFEYSRIDMYNVNGKIYFGEITFCHGSGYEKLSYEWDLKMGKMWNKNPINS